MELFNNSAQWFWQALGTVVVTASLLGVYRQIRLQRYTHVIDSTEKLIAIWQSEPYLRIRKQVCNKLLSDKAYFGSESEELLELFERIGLYVRIGALPKHVVWEAFSWVIEHYYELTKSGIDEMRFRYNDQLLFENFTRLAGEIRRVSRTKYIENDLAKTADELNRFLEAEVATANVLLGLIKHKN